MKSTIYLSAAALKHNIQQFQKVLGKERVSFVLKSNAYGHGLKEIYDILRDLNLKWLSTNDVVEATELRRMGFSGRILVCGPITPDDLSVALADDLDFFIGSHRTWEALLKHDGKDKFKIHIEFDTGMSRLGFKTSEAQNIAEASEKNGLNVVGVCMHFANVEDVTDQNYANFQLKEFDKAYNFFAKLNPKPLRHASASASALLMKNARFDLCRVGISTFGVWPSSLTKVSYLQQFGEVLDLRPVLSWKTEIVQLTSVAKNTYIGYGCTVRTSAAMTLAVIPVGYNEGLPRAVSNRGSYVLIKGVRCAIMGRICMNMSMVDVTEIDGVQEGDEVTLIGTEGDETLHAHDIAGWADTIHYEVFTNLHPAIERVVSK